MNDLPDINIWLALIDKRHLHHELASSYWADPAVQSRSFCRITANGFLRLSTHAKMIPNPLSAHEAWIIYRQFLALPSIRWLPEPQKLDDSYRALSCAPGFAQHLWTDAYLAAFAMANGCRLVSLDGDFKRFSGMSFLHLAPTL